MDTAVHLIAEVKGSEGKVVTGCGLDVKVKKGQRPPDSVTAWTSEITCLACLGRSNVSQ